MRTFLFNHKSLRRKTNKQAPELEHVGLASLFSTVMAQTSCMSTVPNLTDPLKAGNWVLTVTLRFPPLRINVIFVCPSYSGDSGLEVHRGCQVINVANLWADQLSVRAQKSRWQIQIFLEVCQSARCGKILQGELSQW